MQPAKHITPASLVILVLLASGTWDSHVRAQETRGATSPHAAADRLDRTVLPIQEPSYPPITELDARKATAPPHFQVKAPQGAPNVVVVLIDDMGFGQPSTFGGGVAMPTLDRLAAGGLRYNHFHVTALCSPTRAALLTGRNHHSANAGSVMEIATAFPGNSGQIPNSVAPLAEMLRLNGYNTGAFGKWHVTAPWEMSVAGPQDRWPTRQGFEKFYGFLGGETNQWAPLIYDGLLKVEPPRDPNYHFTTDMTTQAITWVRTQQSLTPDKPFFIYYAPGATHAPHHVPKECIAKNTGKFDQGWDKYREETLARQIKLGVVPPDTRLAPKPAAIKDWDALSADEKRLFARQMEVFAAFGEHTDHEIGRLVQAIEDLGVMDNTLFIYIAGDNGASAEGDMTGLTNEVSFLNGVPERLEEQLRRIDSWGDPTTYPHYAAGWATAVLAALTYEIHGNKEGFDLTPGQDLSLNWGISQFLPLSKDQKLLLEVGLTGYSTWQITDDSGSDAQNPSVRDQVHAVGGQLGLTYVPWFASLNVHYFSEFASQDRFQGQVFGVSVAKKF